MYTSVLMFWFICKFVIGLFETPPTWSQLWSFTGLLVWKIRQSTICNFFFLLSVYIFSSIIPPRKIYILFFLFFQLPLLLECWPNIGIMFLISLFLANSGTIFFIYKPHPNLHPNVGNGFLTLFVLYLHLLELWFFPFISFQLAFCSLIFHLDKDIFKTNYFSKTT